MNGLQTIARINFNMGTFKVPVDININSFATGSEQNGDSLDLTVGTWSALNTSSLEDIRWAIFVNDGSGSVAVRISGSTTNLTYLHNVKDASLISMQSGSNPQLIATTYTSASTLSYVIQES
jgi:hypothetical protein